MQGLRDSIYSSWKHCSCVRIWLCQAANFHCIMMPATKYHPGTKRLVSFSSIERSWQILYSILPVSAITFLRQKSVAYCPEKDGLKKWNERWIERWIRRWIKSFMFGTFVPCVHLLREQLRSRITAASLNPTYSISEFLL